MYTITVLWYQVRVGRKASANFINYIFEIWQYGLVVKLQFSLSYFLREYRVYLFFDRYIRSKLLYFYDIIIYDHKFNTTSSLFLCVRLLKFRKCQSTVVSQLLYLGLFVLFFMQYSRPKFVLIFIIRYVIYNNILLSNIECLKFTYNRIISLCKKTFFLSYTKKIFLDNVL